MEGKARMPSITNAKVEYCIYVNTVLEGPRPVERDGQGYPCVYPNLLAAQRAITEYAIERLRQFLAGEREFDDAMTVEEYVIEVDVLPDGAVCDESGRCFGRD